MSFYHAMYAAILVQTPTSSLFQALCQCGRLKKWAGDKWGLVEKEDIRRFLTFDILPQETVSFFKWAE